MALQPRWQAHVGVGSAQRRDGGAHVPVCSEVHGLRSYAQESQSSMYRRTFRCVRGGFLCCFDGIVFINTVGEGAELILLNRKC